MGLPRRIGFFGSMARFVAAHLLVFPFGHAELALREPGRRADRILHPGDCVAIARCGAAQFHLVDHFQ